MATLTNFSTVFSMSFSTKATNKAGVTFTTTNTVMTANGPIRNFMAVTNIGIVASSGLLELAGLSTYNLPVAGNIGGSNVFRLHHAETFNALTRIAEDTGNLNMLNARNDMEREVRQRRMIIAQLILELATNN
jgi:hypothetical protein